MVSLQPFLDFLLSSLPNPPISKAQLETSVRKTLDESRGKSSPENRKSQWEYLLKNEIFNLAVCGPSADMPSAHSVIQDDRRSGFEKGGLFLL
jgi:hypothetical protein